MNTSMPTNSTPSDAETRQYADNQSQVPQAQESPRAEEGTSTPTSALQERIASLEKDLIETRLQLACAKSNEDYMRLELTNMSTALARATASPSACTTSSLFGAAVGNESSCHHSINVGTTMIVPTSNPIQRKTKNGEVRVHRARRTSSKALNPGSCASGLDLLALAQLNPQTSMASSSSFLHRSKKTKTSLNPNSCASGLNLLAGLMGGGLPSYGNISMLSMTSNISASQLLRGVVQQQQQRNGGANPSNRGASRVPSGNNIALLLGNARILSSSSLGGNQNADWGVFE